jgi:AcrR family transcriptional regulator
VNGIDIEALSRSDGVRPPRQPRSAATLTRLLDAAETLIAAHGVDDTSMAAVAAAAHSSIGALYTRFPDKTALVRAVQLRLLQRQFGAVEELLDTDGRPPDSPFGALIERFIATMVRGMIAQAGLLRAVIVHGVRDPVMRERIRLTLDGLIHAFATLLRRHAGELAHPNGDVAADMIIRMVTGTLQQLIILDRPIDEDRLIDELTRAATAYLGSER